ncbi:MAG: SET domain-containing protein [Candidatus Woesearchaeota archaeon]|jgi:SET domain-containing protein
MESTISDNSEVRQSSIHHKGMFATQDILKGQRIIEYVGERVTKAESDRRANVTRDKNSNNADHGAVYLFELNNTHDIDGDVEWNTARFINHSCKENCEPRNQRGKIFILATRNIKKDEEISYNYGFDLEDHKDHPCLCGQKNCVGYILKKSQWHKIKQ